MVKNVSVRRTVGENGSTLSFLPNPLMFWSCKIEKARSKAKAAIP